MRRLLFPALAAFAALNVVAWFHARAMMVFVESGGRTPPMEKLPASDKLRVLLTGVRIPKPVNYRTPAEVGLAFTTNLLKAAGRPEVEAWRIPCGRPRATVAMFHGYADCKASLLDEARAFHDLGCDVWLLDFAGSGGSGGNSTSFGWHESEDVKALAEDLRGRDCARPLILYGFSMGAAAILRAAGQGCRVDGLIAAATFDTMLHATQQRFRTMGLPPFPSAQCLVFWGGVQQEMDGFRNNPADYAAQVTCPTLLFHGSVDVRAPAEQGSNVFARLAGPKKLLIFEGAGHESFHRHDPKKWSAEVGAWMAGLPRDSLDAAGAPVHPSE